ncbi:MAG: cation diffusion facilitator family transporter [Rickettsiales bacterium]
MALSDNTYGPHGGNWIQTEEGFIEISIFEAGTIPKFRLYFYNLSNNPVNVPTIEGICLKTIRPSGETQAFTFTKGHSFLESLEELSEPHEFAVEVKLDHYGHSHTYETQFKESTHHHNGSTEHAHSHGSGLLNKFIHRFGHSHHIAEKVDTAMESHEQGIKALKNTLLILIATALFQTVIVMTSHSVALMADTIHNFADATTSIPLWIAFSLARKGASRRFTYGYGKTEDVAGVFIVFIIFFSACVAAYQAIEKIINPVAMENLGLVSLAAIVGFIGNEVVASYRIRVGKAIGSAALIADGYHARLDGFTSLAVILGVLGAAYGIPIIDPLVGIVITLTILVIVKDTAKAVWIRLIDGIEPEILAQIEHAPTHVKGIIAIHNVRARWIGHRVYADVTIEVDPKLTVKEADVMAQQVEESLRNHVRLLGKAVVQVRPQISAT